MSLKSKVQKTVDSVFEKLKDLSVTATFDNKIVSGFDFSSGETESVSNSYTTTGFLETRKSYERDILVTKTTLTIRSNTKDDVDRYSEVSIDGTKYNCSILSKDDFITVITLVEA